MITDFLDKVLFVIVLYKKAPEESPAFQLLTSSPAEIPSVYIYDNSPTASPVAPNIIYVHDNLNSGVSKAYNEAHKVAKHLNKAWMMLLDQDTVISKHFLEKLSTNAAQHPDSVLFVPRLVDRSGLVSPFRWTGTRGVRLKRVGTTLDFKCFRFQNSGILIRSDAFERAGGYDESIGLDFSDIAFGQRMQKVAREFVVISCELVHGFSGSQKVSTAYAIHRYQKYCAGAFVIGRMLKKQSKFSVWAFLRGMKLTVQHRDATFIKTFFNLLQA